MIEGILTVVSGILALAWYFIRQRQAAVPKQEDEDIDAIYEKAKQGDLGALADLNHQLNDRYYELHPEAPKHPVGK